MANIRQYSAPEGLGLQPTEIGVEARAAAARRGGAFFNQTAGDLQRLGSETAAAGDQAARMAGSAIKAVGNVVLDQAQHAEISHGAVAGSALLAQKTNELNDAVKNSDPNDPTIVPKFMEGLNADLEKFRDGFLTEGGQKYAEQHIEAMRNHLQNVGMAETAKRAGDAVVVNAKQMVNNWTNTAYGDPSSMPSLLDHIDANVSAVVNSSPNLRGAESSRVQMQVTQQAKEQVVKAAAIGFIEKTGKVPEWTSDPKFSPYVNGVELKQFQKAAEAQQRANTYYERQSATLQKQQNDLKVHGDATALMANGVKVDPINPGRLLIAPDFMQKALDIARKNPDAPSAAATVRTMVDWAEQQERAKRETIVTDKSAMNSLVVGLSDPEKPTTQIDILQAMADHKLDQHDGTIALQMERALREQPIKNPQFTNAMKGVQAMLGDGDRGKANFAKFYQEFVPEVQRQEREGKLAPGSLSLSDENSLMMKTLKPYMLQPNEKLLDHFTKNMGIGVAPTQELMTSLSTNAPASKATIPPPEQRENGKTYHTPNGPRVWVKTNAGQGWR